MRGKRRVRVSKHWLADGGYFHCGEVQTVAEWEQDESEDAIRRRSFQEAIVAVDLLAIIKDLLAW